ncbi:MAG: GtrA family protein [Spirochaetes bacterium]|nr:GtrA family protein [Spirochaetota bacterium]
MRIVNRQYFLYIAFALISIVVNITVQIIAELVMSFFDIGFFQQNIYGNITYGLVLKVLSATIVAFLFKFLIDKYFIFQNKKNGITKSISQLLVYGFFAIFTTLIFWGTVFIFKLFLEKIIWEIVGSIIGLSTGYTLKFFLDKKFVFV